MSNTETRDVEAAADIVEEATVVTDTRATALPPNEPAQPRLRRPLLLQDVVSPDDDNDDGSMGFGQPLRSLTWDIPRGASVGKDVENYSSGVISSWIKLKAPKSEKDVTLKLLHRCNILSIRYRLLRLLKEEVDLVDEGTMRRVGQEPDSYCRSSTTLPQHTKLPELPGRRLGSWANSIDVSKSEQQRQSATNAPFHEDDRPCLFTPNETFSNRIVSDMAALEELMKKSSPSQQTKPPSPGERDAPLSPGDAERLIEELRAKINKTFRDAVRGTVSGLSAERKAKARKALVARLLMALGGGVALVGPMLIMVLRPTRLTVVLTPSVCVIATAICLAIFMVDSQPKDVLACTAAYAAVLVVFVGVGGGSIPT
jgi:hypothetical protein